MLWEAREPVLFALCTTGVVCSWCKIRDTQWEQGVSLCLKMWYFNFSSFFFFKFILFLPCISMAVFLYSEFHPPGNTCFALGVVGVVGGLHSPGSMDPRAGCPCRAPCFWAESLGFWVPGGEKLCSIVLQGCALYSA